MNQRCKNMRKLISKRTVEESPISVSMTIHSKCPEKWLFVDLENGNVWHRSKFSDRWRFATRKEMQELKKVANMHRPLGTYFPEK